MDQLTTYGDELTGKSSNYEKKCQVYFIFFLLVCEFLCVEAEKANKYHQEYDVRQDKAFLFIGKLRSIGVFEFHFPFDFQIPRKLIFAIAKNEVPHMRSYALSSCSFLPN